MKMTLDQYILNPMGRKNAVMNAVAREAIASDYLKRYAQVMMREHSNIGYFFFKDEKRNKYVAHIKIPSEVVPKFYYDVVLEFTTDQNVTAGGQDLFKYNCRFFSNDPAFVYTYAYVFNNDELFIDYLRSKMSRKALHDTPNEKNPSQSVGYVKSIYFAYLFMKARDFNKVNIFSPLAKKYSLSELTKSIEHADDKVAARIEAGNKIAKKKSAVAKKEKLEEKITNKVNSVIGRAGNIGKIGTISKKSKITATKSNRK